MSDWAKTDTFKRLQIGDSSFNHDSEDYSGIYKIKNLETDKVYIGQTRDVTRRLNEHRAALRGNRHYNQHLQNSWNKYGENSFTFKIVQPCSVENLTVVENNWMEYYRSYNPDYGYNKLKPSENMETFSRPDKHSKEEMISLLQEFYYMEGRVPTIRDLEGKKYGNYTAQYKSAFGTFEQALRDADLFDFVRYPNLFNRQDGTTKEEIIEKTREFIEKNNYFPSQREMNIDNGLYTQRALEKHFGNMDNLAKLFGYDKETVLKFEKLEALACLREIYEEEGMINFRLIDASKKCKGSKFFYKHFETLPNAYSLAGIDVKENIRRNAKRVSKKRKENFKNNASKSKSWNYPVKESPMKQSKYTKEEVFALINKYEKENSRLPNYKEIKLKNGLVGMNVVEELFRGYRNMMKEYEIYQSKNM